MNTSFKYHTGYPLPRSLFILMFFLIFQFSSGQNIANNNSSEIPDFDELPKIK